MKTRSAAFSQIILTLFFMEALNLASWIPQTYRNANFSLPVGLAGLIPETYRYESLVFFVWAFLIVATVAVLGYKGRAVPILMALFFYLYLALRNSGGGIANNSLSPLWVLIFFALRPSSFSTWMCLFSICFFFFIAGIFKISGMFGCFYSEQLLCISDPIFFANLVSEELVSYSRWSIMGDVIFHYPSLFNFLYFGAAILEVSTILIPFLPRLQHSWAYLIFILHLSIDFFVGVHFTPSPQINIAVLALFFLNLRDKDEGRFNLLRTFAFITIAMIFYKVGAVSQHHAVQSVPGQLMDRIPLINWILTAFVTLFGVHLLFLAKNPQVKILNLLLVPNLLIFLLLWDKGLNIHSLIFLTVAAYVSFRTLHGKSICHLDRGLYPGILMLSISLISFLAFHRLDIYLFACSAALINAAAKEGTATQ